MLPACRLKCVEVARTASNFEQTRSVLRRCPSNGRFPGSSQNKILFAVLNRPTCAICLVHLSPPNFIIVTELDNKF